MSIQGVFAAVLVAAMLALSTAQDVVTLFDDKYGNGHRAAFAVGQYDNLGMTFSRPVVSFSVDQGYELVGYRYPNLGGASKVWRGGPIEPAMIDRFQSMVVRAAEPTPLPPSTHLTTIPRRVSMYERPADPTNAVSTSPRPVQHVSLEAVDQATIHVGLGALAALVVSVIVAVVAVRFHPKPRAGYQPLHYDSVVV